jgi:hypothetical protein
MVRGCMYEVLVVVLVVFGSSAKSVNSKLVAIVS